MAHVINQTINRESVSTAEGRRTPHPPRHAFIFILLLIMLAGPAWADPDRAPYTESSTGRSGIAPIPVIFYTPETSIGLGGSAILFRNHCRCGEREVNDSLAAVVFYTARNQFLAALSGNLYWKTARYHYTPVLAVSRFPLKFYGIGNNTLQDTEETYTPQYIKFENKFEVRALGPLYFGITFLQGYYEILSRDSGGILDNYYRDRDESGIYSGAGFTLRRDTRNNSLSPDRGSNTMFTAVFCDAGIMGDYTFSRFLFDHRSYIPAFRGTTLAVQVLGDAVTGRPPLNYVPKIGGQNMMRGYYQGRYRDNIYVASQVEWRIPLYRAFSAVLFGGAGNVFSRVEDIKLRDPKYAGGVGMRIAINRKERINFRVDIGISPNTEVEKGFEIKPYFNLLEAF